MRAAPRSMPIPATLAALGCVLLVLACRDQGATRATPTRPNLLFIVIDTLRADRVGAYGHARPTTPNIDRLAAEGIRFARAYASAPWTKPSVASMLTGLHPSTHTVIRMGSRLPDSAVTLAERLQAAGYATGAVISHSVIGTEYAYDQGFESFDQQIASGHMSVSTGPVTNRAIALLDSLSAGDAPFFLFVHYFDPHYVYLRHPEYGFAGERPPRISWNKGIAGIRRLDPPPDPTEIQYLLDAYDEEIRHTDEGIGRLLEAIRGRALDDDTLVVLAADHGEEFFERGWLGHSVSVYDELVRVPLVVRPVGAERRSGVVEAPVSLVSLAPTILDALGVSYSPTAFAEPSLASLLETPDGPAPAPVYIELDYRRDGKPGGPELQGGVRKAAIVSGWMKLILDEKTGEESLFDLQADPAEERDVGHDHAEIQMQLEAILHEKMSSVRRAPLGRQQRVLSGEEQRMLRELGYLEADENAALDSQ